MSHRKCHPEWKLKPISAAIILAIPLFVQAQTSTETAAGAVSPELETVTVSGQRLASRRAIASKQASTRIMDSVAADDVQQLPDSTVAETLRRIPGASVTFNNDNVHGRDEAERPVLRGLDARYNNTTVDGLGIASVDSNTVRGARLDLLPSSMIDRLEVFKTWTPDLNPNAIGGSTNVVTRSAFAKGGGFHASMSLAAGNVSNHGEPFSDDGLPKKGEFSISNTWGADNQYGFSVGAYKERVDTYTVGHATTDSVYYNYFSNTGTKVTDPSLSNGYAVPQNNKYFWFQDSRERQGITGKLEAKPSADLSGFITFGNYQTTLKETRNENYISTTLSGTPLGQTANSGRFATGEAELGYSDQPQKRTTNVLQLGGDWSFQGDQQLSFRHGWSKASSTEIRTMYKYIQGLKFNGSGKLPSTTDVASLANTYNMVNGQPVIYLTNPANWTDASKWLADYYRDGSNIQMDNRLDDTRLDWKKNLDEESKGWGVGAGLGRTMNRFNYDSNQFDQGPSRAGLTAEGILSVTNSILPSSGGLPLLIIDPAKARQQLVNNPGYMTANNVTNTAQFLQDDYTFKELLQSAYVMTGYNTQKSRSLFGVRYDMSDIATTGNQSVTKSGIASWAPVSASASYHYLLPSFSTSYDIEKNLKVRAAVAKTIGRPDFSFYAPRISVSEANDGTLSVSKGNPDIKPRESINLDLSVERYLRDGLISLAVFDKKIDNEIYTATATNQPYLYSDGTTRSATISQPQNSSGAHVTGIEVGFLLNSLQDIHPKLSNFGLSSNLTWMKGKLDVTKTDKSVRSIDRLLGQPDAIANLSIFYIDKGLEARLAFNYTGKSLRAVDVNAPWNDVFWKERSQVDFSTRYRWNKSLTIFAEVKNLTSKGVTSLTGVNRDLLKDTYLVSRTFWLGAKWQM